MIPNYFIPIEKIPLTPNGKVNRKRLPSPEESSRENAEEFIAPRTATEQRLVNIWSRILGISRIGIRDNFFRIGGHSLLAAQVIARVKEELNVELPLGVLFEKTSVETLAERIDTKRTTAGETLEDILSEVESMTDEEAKTHLNKANTATNPP